MATSAIQRPRSSLITHTASQLAELIRTGQVSSVEVVQAHLDRIAQVNGSLNAIVTPRFEVAKQEALEADQKRIAGEPLGPLHGVPVTIKDCFHITGLPTTIGVEHLRNNVQRLDAPLVARLRAAGAIVLGKTNVPQLMLLHETDNPVFGRTNNPWSLDHTPGGSSGGEAAAVAAMCSPLGLGNDTGGSIRWPAHCCGIYGIKPTSHRLTRQGELAALRGMEAVQAVSGPLARSVDDLTLALRVLVNQQAERSTEAAEVLGPLPDPAKIAPQTLRVGYWVDDHYFTPSPAIKRAVHEAADRLTQAGVEVVEFQPPEIEQAMRLYFSLLSADGSRDARRLLGKSPKDRRIGRLMLLARMPRPLRAMVSGALGGLGHRQAARLIRNTGSQSAAGYWDLCHRRTQYVHTFWEHAQRERLDAFLMPPFGLPAMEHGLATELLPAGSYAFLMNLLDAPAGVVPMTHVQAQETESTRDRRDYIERYATQTEAASEGLPVGVQVAAWPWREDVVLRLMQVLAK